MMENIINHKIEFESKKSIDDLKTETLNYFQKQGFKLVDRGDDFLHFKRGSIARNMVTFNPLKWKSLIKITFHDKRVNANFDIDIIHQAVTREERRLWESFISNFKITMETGKFSIQENNLQLIATKRSSLKYIRSAILGAIVFGIPSGIIAHFTGMDGLVVIGASFGCVTFMMNKINKER